MDYIKGDPNFGEDQKQALGRLVDAVRTLNERVCAVSDDKETLDAIAEQVNELSAKMNPSQYGRPLPLFDFDKRDDLNNFLSYGFIKGNFNPLAPPMHIDDSGERVIGTCTLGLPYEGPPKSVHGGWISATYDQMLAFANLKRGMGGYTAWIKVEYRKRTPLHEELRFETWTDRVEDRKVFAKGICTLNGELLSEAEGLFIRAEAGKNRPSNQ